MNNYLSSIAARSRHSVPPVCPRLRGRFDPGPLINESAVDRLEDTPPESIASPPPTEIYRPATFENELGLRHKPSSPASDAATEPDTLPVTPRRSKASVDSLRDAVEPPSPTIQVPIATATISKTQPPRLVSVMKTTPGDSGIEQPTEVERAIQTTTVARRSAGNSPDASDIIPTAIRERDSGDQAQPDLATQGPLAPTTAKAPLTRAEQGRVEPRTDHAHPPDQREIETIIVREQEIIERPMQPREPGPNASPVPVIPPSSQQKHSDAKPSPVVVQSRIAPLIEKVAESSSLGRPAPQPQPTVRVTIGRIEVRAVHSSQSQSPAKPRATPTVMNLDDYLRRRSQGGTR